MISYLDCTIFGYAIPIEKDIYWSGKILGVPLMKEIMRLDNVKLVKESRNYM